MSARLRSSVFLRAFALVFSLLSARAQAQSVRARDPGALASRGATELALAFRAHSAPASHELMLSLTVPLERVVAAQVRARAAMQVHMHIDTRWAQRLIVAAWITAGLGESDERLSSLATRARASALLPEARVRLLRTDDARASYDVSDDATGARGTQQVGYTWEGRLTWRLDRLVFADEELGIERLRNERRESREKVRHRVLEAYFQYRRSDADLRTAIEGSREAWESKLKLEEAILTLDALTAGYFSLHQH